MIYIDHDHEANTIQTYLCPKCLERLTIHGKAFFRFSTLRTEAMSASISYNRPAFSIKCNNCNEDMFECDYYLVDLVIALNKKGYRTFACCEGHHKDIEESYYLSPNEIACYPYLVFCGDSKTREVCESINSNPENYRWITLEWDTQYCDYLPEYDKRFDDEIQFRLSCNYKADCYNDLKYEDKMSDDFTVGDLNYCKDTFIQYLREMVDKLEDINYKVTKEKEEA